MSIYDYLIVGAGFAGSVIAERLASQRNKKVLIVEKRNHIGGNAYDEYDEHGILVHRYGPHIFHTNSQQVFEYLSKFTEWRSYEHKVLAKLNGGLYPIPINRITINKLYNKNFSTDEEVAEYYNSIKEKRIPVKTSEDIIVNQVGYDLFEKFFKFYTRKQWNLEPKELAPSVCGRIPVRTNDDCRYFTDKYQYMPKEGYTKMFERMLNHQNIEIALNTDYKDVLDDVSFDKMIYTGPIDYFFGYSFGKLPYRSIEFEFEHYDFENYQKSPVVNHVDKEMDYTRTTEFKKLTGQKASGTTICKEFTSAKNEPYYPILTEESKKVYQGYKNKANKLNSILFIGRLAEFKYYDMDQVVARVLNYFKKII